MRKHTRVLFIMLLSLSAGAGVFAEAFVIDSYHIDVEVTLENAYLITETIDVTFSQDRHGIYRDIPNRYYDHPVMIENVDVEDHQFALIRQSGYLRVRIGDPDVYVNGEQRYVISYRYQVSKDPFEDRDELYFNLIGDRWETTIDGVSFEIRMPASFDRGGINFTYGPTGSTEQAPIRRTGSGTTISGVLKTSLEPREALTVALPLPEGYFSEASELEYPARSQFGRLEIPVDILFVLLAFLFWFFWGRDNRLTTVVEYKPPEGLTPAELGYIIDGSVDSKDVTSLIVYLAHKGYLEIEAEDKGLLGSEMTLTRKKEELDPEEPEFVQMLFSDLFDKFGTDGVVTTKDLKNKFYTTMSKVKQRVQSSFIKNPERRIFDRSKWYIRFFLFLFALFAVVKTVYPVMLEVTLEPGAAWVTTAFAAIFSCAGMTLAAGAFGNQQGFRRVLDTVKIVFGLIFGAGSFFGIYMLASATDVFADPVYFVATPVVVFIVLLFSHLMLKRTPHGDMIVERVLGLREFVRAAEQDRIERLFDENPSYFYDILPYAIVLELSDVWAKHFDALTVEPPDWYRSDRRTGFSAAAFQRDLDKSFTSLNSSMTSSPSSSGSSSSSGGSSGGGAGGGGGGSW